MPSCSPNAGDTSTITHCNTDRRRPAWRSHEVVVAAVRTCPPACGRRAWADELRLDGRAAGPVEAVANEADSRFGDREATCARSGALDLRLAGRGIERRPARLVDGRHD